MDGRFQTATFNDGPSRTWISPEARVEEGATIEGPCFIDEGAVVKAGARIGPYTVVGRHCHIEEHAAVERSILWANTRIGQDAVVRGAILGRHCPHRPERDARRWHRARRQVRRSPISAVYETRTPTFSRPTTSAAPIRTKSTKTAARAIGAAFVDLPEGEAHRGRPRHAAVVAGARRGVHRRRRHRRAPTSSTTA